MRAKPDKHSALTQLLRETREDHEAVPAVNWDGLEAKLFARIAKAESEAKVRARPAAPSTGEGSPRIWAGVAMFAAAAGLAVVAGQRTSPPSFEGALLDTKAAAGALATHDGRGDVRVNGEVVETGRALAVGSCIDTTDGRGVFLTARGTDPKAVTWAVEERSRVEVARAPASASGLFREAHDDGSPLVLRLVSGAVEAQVDPIAQGEAFAIDVDGVRVAVHGTHLRVARQGAHVVVDLSEGVVSVGIPPRTGSTYGTLVSAPAHLEFDVPPESAQALAASIRVNHEPTSVRAPIPLVTPLSREESKEAAREEGAHVASAMLPGAATSREGDKMGAAAHDPAISPRPARAEAAPFARAVGRLDGVEVESAISLGVKACAASAVRPADIKVTVNSRLTLRVGDDGNVQSARFEPPLAPASRDCATQVIYRAKFEHGGTVEIPIEIAP